MRWVLSTLMALVFLCLLFFFCIDIVRISDGSMAPSLQQGDIVLIDRVGKHIKPIGRSQMITYKDSEGQLHLGRVIALSGESICCIQGGLYINESFYVKEQEYTLSPCTDFGSVSVPEGSVFILSDDRGYMGDSRDTGCIPLHRVIGRVHLKLWPAFSLFK